MKNILTSEEFRSEAELIMSKTEQSAVIFSGFIKSSAIHWLIEHLTDAAIKVDIVGRLSPSDLISGASDLEIYKICNERGWKLGILQNLHSKVFVFDRQHLMLGSANLTMRGLSLKGFGNLELGTRIIPSEEDLKRLEKMKEEVVWINDELYEDMQLQLNNYKSIDNNHDTFQWSHELEEKLKPSNSTLWVDDLFHSSPQNFIRYLEESTNYDVDRNDEYLFEPASENDEVMHDVNLFDATLTQLINNLPEEPFTHKSKITFGSQEDFFEYQRLQEYLPYKLMETKIFKWLENLLKENNDHSHKNFGWVTSQLHDALMDDPAPSRGGVKFFVDNLFKWVEAFGYLAIHTTHFKQTTGLELINLNDNETFLENITTYVQTDKQPSAKDNIARTEWVGGGKTYYQIKNDNSLENQYLHRIEETGVSLNGHIEHDLNKGFIKKSSDSWVGGPYDKECHYGILAKMPDLSTFRDSKTGVPQRLYSFFGLDKGSKDDIGCDLYIDQLGKDPLVFKAKFIAEKNSKTKRYILKWGEDLGNYLKEQFPQWWSIKKGRNISNLNPDDDLLIFSQSEVQSSFNLEINPLSDLTECLD
jgi:hypothetical protein